MTEERHYFVPAKTKKDCEKCHLPYSECMSWVDLFVVEGPKGRDFYWKTEKANYVTDLYTFELVQTIPTLEENIKIVTIESTRTMSYLLNKKGQIISWGLSENSEEGSMFTHPMMVKEITGIQIVAMACGDQHVLALEIDMYVWAWGSNEYGQLSRDDSSFKYAEKDAALSVPKRVEDVNNIVRIAAGPNCSFAVHMNGTVYAWGKNSNFSLGIEYEGHVRKATELSSCPWVKEVKKNKKSYFKSEKTREFEIAGASLSKIRAMKVENMDLHNRILMLSKKVDFLEDEVVGGNNRRMQKLWDSDNELKELIRLKENCENLNKNYDKQVNEINEQIEDLKAKEMLVREKVSGKEKELLELWDSIMKIEREMKKVKKEAGFEKDANEKKTRDIDSEIITKAEARKEQQAEFMNKEMEKKNLEEEIRALEKEIMKKEEEQEKIMSKLDRNIKDYKKMASIKKKQIAEQNILKFSSRTYQEIEDIKRVYDTIEKSAIEYLTMKIGKFSHPEEIISISNQMLEELERYVKDKFKVSGFTYVGNTRKIWVVIHDMIKTALDVNQLKHTICTRLLKSSKMDARNCIVDDKAKMDVIKDIFKCVGIFDFNVVFDHLSQKLEDKEKKASMKKIINEGPKKKSSWRSCF